MKRMGFSKHPGPLPFGTIRSRKWANYTWVGEIIEIHGEHGCDLPPTPARVVSIEDYTGEVPPRLAGIYRSKPLHMITLEAVVEPAAEEVVDEQGEGEQSC